MGPCKIALLAALLFFLITHAPVLVAQDPHETQDAAAPSDPASGTRQGPGEGRPPGLLGKIIAVHDASLQVHNPDGETVTVKLTDKTEFRKDRQPAKRTDFKVGDLILVRGEENPDRSWTAQVIGARSATGPAGRGGNGGPGAGFLQGTLGKDYVVGEIKSIDAPNLSVLRSDNVTQSLELNEETSLRKGRESITIADIQAGDYVFARGAVQNNVFVARTVMVMGPEQWKRMQEFARPQGRPANGPPPQTQKPSEPPN